MKNMLKKTVALVLALALCLSFAGCYSENNTWAAKLGDDTMPIGGYIYYLSTAYNEAAMKISSDIEVLDGEVDGQPAQEWIENRALDYLYGSYYLETKLQELGQELTEDEEVQADSITNSTWAYYQTAFENMGISRDSFHRAYSVYSIQYQKLMKLLYGEGGEMAIPQEELEQFYQESYYPYEYFYVSLSTTDEDGNSVERTDEEKEELKSTLEDYAKQITDGDMTVEEASTEYGEETGENVSYSGTLSTAVESITDTLGTALAELDEESATVTEATSGYYVVYKRSYADGFADITADEDQTTSLIAAMKGDEFEAYVMEQGRSLGVELNQGAIDHVKLSSLIDDSNRNGASSAAESSESSETESSASSESSEVSSEASQVSSQAEE